MLGCGVPGPHSRTNRMAIIHLRYPLTTIECLRRRSHELRLQTTFRVWVINYYSFDTWYRHELLIVRIIGIRLPRSFLSGDVFFVRFRLQMVLLCQIEPPSMYVQSKIANIKMRRSIVSCHCSCYFIPMRCCWF